MGYDYSSNIKYQTGLPGTREDDYPCITGAEKDCVIPSKVQIGGNHYAELPIQPSEFIYKNGLNWLEGNAIKYICRHHAKNGAQDIDKAIHYLQLLKEWQYGEG